VHRVAVLIFAKYPEPGRVKTRLVPPLTPEEAASVHAAALRVVCDRAVSMAQPCGLPSAVEVEPALVVTPDDSLDAMRRLVGDGMHAWLPQGGGDLGARLSRATDRAFRDGVEAVILLGADSPTLPRSILRDAINAAPRHDAILGPCDDGGYYLLGMRRPAPALFRGIDWGSEDVAEQTRRRAASAGLDLFEWPIWYDLDRFDDLKRARGDLMDLTDPPSDAMVGYAHPTMLELQRLIDALVTRYAVDGGRCPPYGRYDHE